MYLLIFFPHVFHPSADYLVMRSSSQGDGGRKNISKSAHMLFLHFFRPKQATRPSLSQCEEMQQSHNNRFGSREVWQIRSLMQSIFHCIENISTFLIFLECYSRFLSWHHCQHTDFLKCTWELTKPRKDYKYNSSL